MMYMPSVFYYCSYSLYDSCIWPYIWFIWRSGSHVQISMLPALAAAAHNKESSYTDDG